MLGIPRQQRTGETVTDKKLLLIWEVYARIDLAPETAVDLLTQRKIASVTPDEAKRQMDQARRRNTLRLVFYKADTP